MALFVGFIFLLEISLMSGSDVKTQPFSYRTTYNPAMESYVTSLLKEKYIFVTCPSPACLEFFLETIRSSQVSIRCAFFDIDQPYILDALEQKRNEGIDVSVVVDGDQYDIRKDYSFLIHENRSSYMHNKFCIFDGTVVMTGTWNPTRRGTFENNNTVLYLYDRILAREYANEFEELADGIYSKGKPTTRTSFALNNSKRTEVEIYFCPDDWCVHHIVRHLRIATQSISFETFSFTHPWVADVLIEKHKEGLIVEGICEKSQNNRYHQFERLRDAGIDVTWDSNAANMHNKLFVIDDTTIIVGSMNPSKNGDLRNDENFVIVKNFKKY